MVPKCLAPFPGPKVVSDSKRCKGATQLSWPCRPAAKQGMIAVARASQWAKTKRQRAPPARASIFDEEEEEGSRLTIDKEEGEEKHRVVVLGTGWSAYAFLSGLSPDHYEVIVVSPRNYFLYTPLLPGAASGTVEDRSIVEPIRQPLSKKGFLYYEAECLNVNAENQTILCRAADTELGRDKVPGRSFSIRYDFLVVAVGAVPNTFGIPGVEENAVFFKEMNDAAKLRREVHERLERATLPGTSIEEQKNLLSFIFVGAGPTGVELSAELYDTFTQDVSKLYPPQVMDTISIGIVDLQERVLSAYDERISQYTAQVFRRNGIDLYLNKIVKEVRENNLLLEDRSTGEVEELPFGLCVWCAGFKPNPLTQSILESLPPDSQDNKKFLKTDKSLRVFGADGTIFAIGDCATVERPKSLAAAERFFDSYRTVDGYLTLSELKQVLKKGSQEFPHLEGLAQYVDDEYYNLVGPDDKGITFAQFKELLSKVDSQLRSFPLTAQVAKQEGDFAASLFNQAAKDPDFLRKDDLPQFKYKHRGQLAYIGQDNAVAELSLPSRATAVLRGFFAGLLWKGYETYAQFSLRNKILVLGDWVRTAIFGRDVSRIR